MIDYSLIFLTGLLASLHCVGMCGPIVLVYSTTNPQSRMAGHLAYNTGRLSVYTFAGACIGYFGQTLSILKVTGHYFSMISGLLMLLAGSAILKVILVPDVPIFLALQTRVSQLYQKLFKQDTFTSKYCLGGLTIFLPCGMLYALLVKAAATQSILAGAMTMFVFALGTVPTLLFLGKLSGILSAKVRKNAEAAAGVMVIFLGWLLFLRGWQSAMACH